MKISSAVLFATFAVASMSFSSASCPESCTDDQGSTGVDRSLYCDPTNQVGCGSCLGTGACTSTGPIAMNTIGDSSCTGPEACMDAASSQIGDGSCVAGWGRSCKGVSMATIADASCLWANACGYAGGIAIGTLSCKGKKSCYKAGNVQVEQGEGSVGIMPITIGANSCNGKRACCGVQGDVLDNECNGDYACCNSDITGCNCQ